MEGENIVTSPELSAFAAVTYTAILASFTATTVIALGLHLVGRHQNCVRNLVISALLAALSLLASGMKTYFTAQPLTQDIEATAYLTMFLSPFALLFYELYELNNREARALQEKEGKAAVGFKITQNQTSATSQNSQEHTPATTHILQEYEPAQTQVSAQETVTPPTPPLNNSRPQPPTSTAKNISRNIGTSVKPASQSGKATAKGKLGEKKIPTIEDIIYSEEYALLLARILVKILRKGVRYNGKLYRMHLTFLRYQDIIYIWQLGKKNKKKKIPKTARGKHRLHNLKLVRVSGKAKPRESKAETVEDVELTERGWAVRNAIAIAAMEIQKRLARSAAPYIQ